MERMPDGKPGTMLLELRARDSGVLGPGSTHPNGNRYISLNSEPIREANYEELINIMHQIASGEKVYAKRELVPFPVSSAGMDAVRRYAQKVKISDLLRARGIEAYGNLCECPFHASMRGHCFSFDDTRGVWNCFHCRAGGSVIKLHRLLSEPVVDVSPTK